MTERVSDPVATLVVRRGEPGEVPRWSRHEVPFQPGQSVLDGLRRARIESDPSLAVRFSCLNANACKECMMLLDGKVIYACTARLEPREMRLEPLANKALVRDLVTEIAPPDERLANRRIVEDSAQAGLDLDP
jgi:succinate dehydrogenase/fumarate reductase-like Fe-S protein